jgi:hypothetical protein
LKTMSKTTTKLQRIAEVSRKEPDRTFNNLMYLFNKEALKECFNMLDGKKEMVELLVIGEDNIYLNDKRGV